MKYINNNKVFVIFLFLISVIFITFFSTSTSPIYGTGDYDSCGYVLMGMEIANGNVPYLSISDNKGPVLWIIEGIGQFIIKGKTGVYLTQCVFMFLCLLFITKIVAELFGFSKRKQTICCIIYLIVIASIYSGGNFTEEFSLFFIVISLYIVSLFINKKISYFNVGLVLSISITSVIFIRINDCLSIVYMWLLVVFAIFYQNKDKLNDLKKYILGSISGFSIVFIPILIYYGLNNAFVNMIEDYFLIGMGYAKNNLGFMAGLIKRIVLLFNTGFGHVLVLSFIYTLVSIYICKNAKTKIDNKLLVLLIFGINVSIIIAAIVKPTGYGHYLMPVSVSYVLIVSLFLHTYEKILKSYLEYKKILSIVFLLSIILINYFAVTGVYSSFINIMKYGIIKNSNQIADNNFRELSSVIPDEDRNKGLAFKSPKWYLVTNTRPIIKYIWTDTLEFNEKELSVFLESLDENPPKWLFVTDEKELKSLGEEAYVFFANNYVVKKENSSGKIYFYSK